MQNETSLLLNNYPYVEESLPNCGNPSCSCFLIPYHVPKISATVREVWGWCYLLLISKPVYNDYNIKTHVQDYMKNPGPHHQLSGCITSYSAAPAGESALHLCSATSFQKGDGETPSCGLLSAEPPSKRACNLLLLVLIGSTNSQRRPCALGQAAPIQSVIQWYSHEYTLISLNTGMRTHRCQVKEDWKSAAVGDKISPPDLTYEFVSAQFTPSQGELCVRHGAASFRGKLYSTFTRTLESR